MPRKTKAAAAAKTETPQIPAELLEQLIPGPVTPAEFEDIFQRFKKAFMERALGAEMTQHLGYKAGETKPEGTTNHRNGKGSKTVLTDSGEVTIEVPRDRQGTFEPQLIGKHERRFTGFDDKIVAMYARGMAVREIQKFLAEMYAVDVSPDLISRVTDAVVEEVAAWQSRPLEALAAAVKPIYTAPSAEAAEAALHAFESGEWGRRYPTVVAAWRRAWDRVIPFFAFPPDVRRVIYTTNAIESVNAQVRKSSRPAATSPAMRPPPS